VRMRAPSQGPVRATLGPRLCRAVAADRQTCAFPGVAVTVLDQETCRAGELVGLFRHDPHREFLPRQVRTGQLETLGGVGLIDVDNRRRGVVAPLRELIQRVLGGIAPCTAMTSAPTRSAIGHHRFLYP